MQLRTTVSMLTLALAVPTASFAQTAAANAEQAFSIPSGPLSQSLAAFGRQTGLQVTYLPETAGDRQSPGASGPLSTRQALARLLSGTGLGYRFANATTVVIERQQSNETAAGSSPGAIPLATIDVIGGRETAWGPVQGYVAHQSATGRRRTRRWSRHHKRFR